ncbi:MAG: hypothetical protein IPL10_10875 [Bacteroidetes bacterium]|jgi:hypothetical protein|nr:hypothetical protein [Bacteroidota bacterium]
MKHKTTFFIILSFLFGQDIISQSDTLNKFNTKGKKTGYWKVLLDEKINPTKINGDAHFYCFEFWDEGKNVTQIDKHRWKKNKLICDNSLPNKGNPIPISGKFKWFDKKGRLISEEVYENGNPIYFKSYFIKKSDTTLHINEDIDFTKRYNNIIGTFYFEMHSSNGNTIDKYWYRKGQKGWKAYKIEN